MPGLHDHFADSDRRVRDSFGAERCVVATTAAALADKVWVTFPFSDDPALREEVHYWRLGINPDGTARYPTRGDTGMVIYLDTGELWLIF